MKLMYCAHCKDIVRLFSERRSCKCGKSWGQYLEDDSTTVQTWPSLSIGIANPDFTLAERTFGEDVNTFSPLLSMRCWINPLSEPDVRMVMGEPFESEAGEAAAEDAESAEPAESADQDAAGGAAAGSDPVAAAVAGEDR